MLQRIKNLLAWSKISPVGNSRVYNKGIVKEVQSERKMASIVEDDLPNILEQEENDTTS